MRHEWGIDQIRPARVSEAGWGSMILVFLLCLKFPKLTVHEYAQYDFYEETWIMKQHMKWKFLPNLPENSVEERLLGLWRKCWRHLRVSSISALPFSTGLPHLSHRTQRDLRNFSSSKDNIYLPSTKLELTDSLLTMISLRKLRLASLVKSWLRSAA